MLVVTSQKLKGATCKRSGKKLVRTRVCTVASGVLVYEVYAFESVVCMRQATCCLEFTSLKNLTM